MANALTSVGVVDRGKDGYLRQQTADQLTSTQLQRLLNTNSGYIKSARISAEEAAAKRGGLGGTLAAGAAQKAAIDSAAPIAQADAETYIRASQDSLQSLAGQRQANTQAEAQVAAANASAGGHVRSAEIQAESSLARARLDAMNRIQLTELEQDHALQMAELGQQYNLTNAEINQRYALERQDDQQAADLLINREQWDFQSEENRLRREHEYNQHLNQLNQEDRQFFLQLEQQYGITAAQTAMSSYNTAMASIAQVMSNPESTQQEKDAATQFFMSNWQRQMELNEQMFPFFPQFEWNPVSSWAGG